METTTKPRVSSDKEGKVITLIFSPDEDKDRLYRLPKGTSCRDVITRWTKDCNPSFEVLLLPDDSDQPLDDDTLLESLSCAPDVQVSLHAIPATFQVSILLDSSQPPRKLQVSPVDLPEQLASRISKQFELPREQKLRLRLDHRVLEAGKAIWRQEVLADSHLNVELEYSGSIYDRFTNEFVDNFSLFASDPASALKCPPYLAVQRFWLKNRLLPSKGIISEVFAGAETFFNLVLQVERQQSVLWMRGLAIGPTRDLWPSSRLPAPPKPSTFLQFDKRPLDLLCSAAQLRLPPHALLQCRSITVLLRTAPRRFAVRTLPAGASAADLEPRSCVVLAPPIKPAALLSVRVGASLFDVRKMLTVEVQLSAKENAKLQLRQAAVKFSDILIALRNRLGSTVEQRTVAFACVGCARKMRREEEAFQEVPANCCKQQSRVLRLVRRSQKRGTQATTFKRTADEGCQTVVLAPLTEDFGVQTLVESNASRMTQTSTCFFDEDPQLQDAQFVLAPQKPLEEPDEHEVVQFFVCNWARLGQHTRDFRCTLLLPKEPQVGDVLNALVAELGVPPERVRLKQWRAKSADGRPLTWVCRQAGHPGDEYGDIDGAIFRRKNVVEDAGVELHYEDSFSIVPGRRNIVVVIQN